MFANSPEQGTSTSQNQDLSQQLILIDSNLEGIVDNISLQPNTQLHYFDNIDEISSLLLQEQNLNAVHIFSHGDSGTLQLGDTTLNNGNLTDYQDTLTQWGNSLTENGDILFYGCNLAQGQAGQDFVNQLANITGRDIPC